MLIKYDLGSEVSGSGTLETSALFVRFLCGLGALSHVGGLYCPGPPKLPYSSWNSLKTQSSALNL